ncbi:DUF707 domain-containing protein [Ideonella livida]|uniref:DUF707 domain-containing protein n=1 Tax=Ideonella livida TaxID=2707176 RepID=A0A7C9PEJ9_9BURK|nr:DUF707 domain-containing protein [Ideonella livida]NDY89917.1 DUF707 domain-containing protein [Ideonella livida]
MSDAPPLSERPYLILWRAGPGSLHPQAMAGLAQQNFDVAFSWYGDEPPAEADQAVFTHLVKGAKWPGLQATLAQHWDTVSRYQYVWIPDDDLACTPENASRLFAICADLRLELAQPALSHDSYFAHPITLQHPAFQLRFTNFVEIMAPVLSVDFLARVYPTLDGAISGYGLDSLWPRLSALGRLAIVDDTPIRHTRPLGGPNYAFSQKAGRSPLQEDGWVCATHFIESASDQHLSLGGLLQNGDAVCLGASPTELDVMLEAVLASLQPLVAQGRLSAAQLTRYLGHHLAWWQGGEQGRVRYGRQFVRAVLEQALAPAGLHFGTPAARPAVEAGSLARAEMFPSYRAH